MFSLSLPLINRKPIINNDEDSLPTTTKYTGGSFLSHEQGDNVESHGQFSYEMSRPTQQESRRNSTPSPLSMLNVLSKTEI